MITPPMLDFCYYLQSASGILACLWSFKASLWQLEGLAERRSIRCQNLQSIATRNTSVSQFGSIEGAPWTPSVRSSVRLDHPIVTTTQHQAKASQVEHQGWTRRSIVKMHGTIFYHTMDLAYLPSRRDVNSWWLCDKLIWNVRTWIRTCDKPCVPGEMM